MSLVTRLTALVQAIGADIKALKAKDVQLDLQDETRTFVTAVRSAVTFNVNIAAPLISLPAPSVGTNFLLMGQTNKTQNGLYTYNGANTPMTRTGDANASYMFAKGKLVYSMQEDLVYQYTGPDFPQLGVTELPFAQAGPGGWIAKDLFGINLMLGNHDTDITALKASDSAVARAGVLVKGQRTTNVAVGSTYVGPIGFDEVKDVGDAWNGSRFQPKTPGTYIIRASLALQQPQTGLQPPEGYICKNAPTNPTPTQIGAAKVATNLGQVNGTWSTVYVEQQVEMNGTTDYVEIFMWSQSGGTLNFSGYLTTFAAELVGAQITNPARRIKGRIDVAGTVATSAHPALYSVVRNSVGDYTITLNTPMNGRPSVQISPLNAATNAKPYNGIAPTASTVRVASFVEDPTSGIVMTDGSFEFTIEEYGLGLQATMDVEPWRVVGAAGQPVFANAWTHYDQAGGRVARFKKLPDGMVVIDGVVKSGTLGQVVFVLPVGYRPGQVMGINQINSGGNTGQLTIDQFGQVIAPASPAGNGYLYLTGITFFADN